MEWSRTITMDVHFEPEDLTGLQVLLNVIHENTKDLDGGVRSLDLGGNAERVYRDLSKVAKGDRF